MGEEGTESEDIGSERTLLYLVLDGEGLQGLFRE